MTTKILCENPRCRHIDQVHDDHGCVMLGCLCNHLELTKPVEPIRPTPEFFYESQAA